MSDSSPDIWHVLYTKPHGEPLVCAWLSKRGFNAYLPLVRSHTASCKDRMEPLFPCYLFAELDPTRDELTSLSWTPGLRRIVAFDGRPATVDAAFVEQIRDRLDTVNLKGWVPFNPGDRVRVTEGPFRDMVGVFQRPCSAARRVQILLHVLGRQNRCDIDVTWLKTA